MIRIFSCILILLLARQPLTAADQRAEAASEHAEASRAGGGSAASPLREIDELKELIRIQQSQIQKLQSAVEQQQRQLDKAMTAIEAQSSAKPGAAAVAGGEIQREKVDDVELLKGELEAVADSAAQANQRLTKVEADAATTNKTVEAKSKQLGNFNFSGDIRVRYEPFFQEGAPDRHRERFRARLNVTGKLSDEFSGGISVATGTLDDPISTNQTMTGFLNRKSFGIDRGYITYKPKYAKNLRLDAGKFAYPWYRTPMTFDSDVNPEGFAETLSFDVASSSLQNVTLVGIQLPFNEVSSGPDSFIFGGQIQTHFRLGSRARLSLYGAGLNIMRADPIAVALGNGSLKPSLPNSNTFRTNASGAVIGYANKFAYLDAILKLDLDTNPRFPTTLLFNFVNNVRGSRERSGYWAEATVGRNKEAGDVQFGYSFIRIEKDAVIGVENESDLRSSTNVLNHRLIFGYMIKNNVTGQFTAWIGKLANPWENPGLVPPGVRAACTGADLSNCEDPYLKRLQLDVIYKF